MAPKRTSKGLSATEQAIAQQASDLRSRAKSTILVSSPSEALHTTHVPRALSKCDGCDIVKKNTSRKSQKYLFAFPGGLNFTSGARIGTLTGLDTATPSLYIEFPEGRIRLRGTLVYPKNAWLGLKSSGKKVVKCQEVFETLIVFSEWSWVGKESDEVEEMPEGLRRVCKREKSTDDVVELGNVHNGKEIEPSVDAKEEEIKEEPVATEIVISEAEDEDEDDAVEVAENSPDPPRSQPRRASRKNISYSGLFDSDDSDESNEEVED